MVDFLPSNEARKAHSIHIHVEKNKYIGNCYEGRLYPELVENRANEHMDLTWLQS